MKHIERGLPEGARVRVTFLTERIVRVQIARDGPFRDTGLNRYGFIMDVAEEDLSVEFTEEEDGFTARGEAVSVRWKDPGELVVADNATGEALIRQVDFAFDEKSARARFRAREDEDWIGFGDQTRERLYHRGHVADLYVINVKSYIPVPFFMSTHGVGFLANTTHRIVFDMCKSDPEHYTVCDHRGALDYYVIAGAGGFRGILSEYTALTGRPKLPPEWAFGLWYICRTQANDHEAIGDALNFRREEIPCDVIGLEPGWMETLYDKSTEKDWSKERFPIPFYAPRGPNNFLNAIKRMGYHFELWLCCEYDLSYEAERRAGCGKAQDGQRPAGGGHGPEAEIDEHLVDARWGFGETKRDEPWFEHLKKFVDQGVDFFKQDGAYQVCPHPDRLWGNRMTDAEMHNLYPLLYARQMYEGFLEHTGRRPVVFTPAGWTGFQAWCGTWTGDTGGGIGTLGAMLNTSIVGHSWCTNDMETADAEGIHFGYLQPWSQINSWNYFRMPWLQGDRLCRMHKDYSRLRARLIPYIYSWAYQATRTGFPLLVPLTLEYPDDENCRDVLSQYLLGRDLMVCVYNRDVYLPAGRWKDYWTGEVLEGGWRTEIDWPETRGGGLFLRSGGIVPHGPLMQYRKQRPTDEIELVVFPDANESSMDFYEDDGVSLRHLEGEFAVTRITARCDGSEAELTVGETKGSFAGGPGNRTWAFSVAVDFTPSAVTADGAELPRESWRFDEARKMVLVRPLRGPVSVAVKA